MKDLTYFGTENDYKNHIIEYPNVSYTEDNNMVWIKGNYPTLILTFKASEKYTSSYEMGEYDSNGLVLFQTHDKDGNIIIKDFSNIKYIKFDNEIINIDELDEITYFDSVWYGDAEIKGKGFSNLKDNSIHILEIAFNDVSMYENNYEGNYDFINFSYSPFLTDINIINFKNVDLRSLFFCRKYNTLSFDSKLEVLGYHYNLKFNEIIVNNNDIYESYDSFFINKETKELIDVYGSFNNLVIPNGIEIIGEGALIDEYDLISVEMPQTLKTIKTLAFIRCENLNSITCYATTAPTFGYNAFKNLSSSGTLRVPQGSDYSTWLSILGSGWTIEYIS